MKRPSKLAAVGIVVAATMLSLALSFARQYQTTAFYSALQLPTPTPLNNGCRWITEPHQGASIIPVGSYVWGVQARIGYANPAYNCRGDINSWTNEWVMVVGPNVGTDWVQFGWTRNFVDNTVHAWSQWDDYRGLPQNTDYNVHPTGTSVYAIEQAYDGLQRAPWWNLTIDGQYVDNIFTDLILWGGQPFGDHGTQAQYYGEVTHLESNMGDWYPGVRIDQPIWKSDNGSWNTGLNALCINSPLPRYGGRCGQYLDGTLYFDNWTWPHQTYLPLLIRNP